MLFPYNTDAPLYYRPTGTILLIVVNFITFFLTAAGLKSDGWLLQFGNGLHPTEWILSSFLHFGPWHLLGNMFYLWVFGLVVEGKIGTSRFLGLYFLLSFVNGFLEQLIMLWSTEGGGAGGASDCVFGLMMICLFWAPANHIYVVWIFSMLFVKTFEVSVLVVASSYLFFELLDLALSGFSMGSALLHMIGACTGAVAGYVFLKYNWVDCEGWDLFHYGKKLAQPGAASFWGWKGKTSKDVDKVTAPPPKTDDVRTRLQRHIDNGQYQAAFFDWEELQRRKNGASSLQIAPLRTLIEGLQRLQQWRQAVVLLEQEYLPRQPADANRARVKLAAILVKELQRPKAALKHLQDVSITSLSPEEQKLVRKIQAAATAQIDDGTMELA